MAVVGIPLNSMIAGVQLLKWGTFEINDVDGNTFL
jgi:hypothetical protein